MLNDRSIDTLALVGEFHKAFGHSTEIMLTVPDAKILSLRLSLILEEFIELTMAMMSDTALPDDIFETQKGKVVRDLHKAQATIQSLGADAFDVDMTEVADALGDIKYVVDGTAHVMGIPLNSVSEEIHRSNMSKLGRDGKPIYNEFHKIEKGPDYYRPSLKLILDRVAGELV